MNLKKCFRPNFYVSWKAQNVAKMTPKKVLITIKYMDAHLIRHNKR